jgi:phosphatidylglycerophosphate synthase
VTFKKQDRAENIESSAGLTRLRALQNPLDRALYHPLSARLAHLLARTPVTPNMVSVAGGLLVVLAGIAYVQPRWPFAALMGLCLHMSWHVLDGADGDLARLTGRISPTGEIVDGICDYSGHIVLYLLLGSAAFASAGWVAWMLVIAAGVSRILQANFYEAQRRQYLGWVHGMPWLRTSPEEVKNTPFQKLGNAYLAVADQLAPSDADIDQAMADPARRDPVRTALLHLGPKALTGSDLLGANYRTLALGLLILAGSPLWYFLYEATILNLVLAHAVWRSRRNLAAIRATL